MKIAERISITITGECSGPFKKGHAYLLDVEEFHPYEPSAYVWTPGWGCAVTLENGSVTHWFFVDECGSVWYNGSDGEKELTCNEECGICPSQDAEYNKMLERERELEATYGAGWPE